MEYVKPNRKLKSFTCPHCHTLSLHENAQHHFNADIKNNEYHSIDIVTQTYILRCLNCGKKTIWIDDEYIYPGIVPQEPNIDMPESVRQLYIEAGLIYNKSPRAACALLRLAIERLCNELGETDRDINKNIAALVKKGLPVGVQKSLDIVRVVGNKAVHPGQIAFDVEDVKTAEMLFNLVNIIVDRLISEPSRLKELYEVLPESVKEQIEERDKK